MKNKTMTRSSITLSGPIETAMKQGIKHYRREITQKNEHNFEHFNPQLRNVVFADAAYNVKVDGCDTSSHQSRCDSTAHSTRPLTQKAQA